MLIKLSMMDDFVWRDIFDFLHPTEDRKKLALISEMGDHKFSNVCQKWLHEWTKNVQLGTICIISPPPPPAVELLPEVELPENVHDFEEIQIRHLDTSVLQFLRRIQPLFHDVNLHVNNYHDEMSLDATRTTLRHLLPLLTGGIETANLISSELLLSMRDHLPTQQQFFGIERLAMYVRKPSGDEETLAELLHQWLGTSLENGQPKIAELLHCRDNDNDITLILGLLERIRQHFPNQTSQASFYIRALTISNCLEAIQESTTHNGVTNEQLLIRTPVGYELLIGRCPSELNGWEWMTEMNNKLDAYDYDEQIQQESNGEAPRLITVFNPTLGQIEEA